MKQTDKSPFTNKGTQFFELRILSKCRIHNLQILVRPHQPCNQNQASSICPIHQTTTNWVIPSKSKSDERNIVKSLIQPPTLKFNISWNPESTLFSKTNPQISTSTTTQSLKSNAQHNVSNLNLTTNYQR